MDNKRKKILTIEDLVKLCENQKLQNFNAKDTGYELCVQVPATLVYEKEEENTDTLGILFTKLKVCHTNLNVNGSYISEKNMKKAMPSLKYRPLLAHIHQLDNGEYDFHSHDMEIDENNEITYIEKQIGTITADEPYLEYDKDNDKTYVIAYAAIPEDYTMAADIIRKKNGTTVSCELSIISMSYNATEHYLELEDFYFSGVSCLGSEKNGKEIKPGMQGARLDIADFSKENNSIIKYSETVNEKLIETLDKLNCTIESLSKFNINSTEKVGLSKNEEGGDEKEMTKFEELLKKYNKTEADITFEVEGLSDEELETKFAELFEEDTTDTSTEGTDDNADEPKDGTAEGDEGTDTNADTNTDESEKDANVDEPTDEPKEDETATDGENFDNKEEKIVPKFSVTTLDGTVKEFELSLDDITNALYSLINNTYSEADNTWYSVTVYDNGSLIMHDWYNNRAYRQSYKQDGDNFSLAGDRVEVYSVWVTKEEQESLNEMKANYSSIQTELNAYKEAQLDAEKELIFSDEAYADFIETDEFKAIKDEMKVLSTDELRTKCDLAFAKLVKTAKTFSMKEKDEDNKKKPNKIGVMSTFENNADNEPYGDYFRSLEK